MKADTDDFLDSILGNGPLSNLPGHHFVKEFEDKDLLAFTEFMIASANNPKIKEIFIWVSSYGGSVHNVFAMTDLINAVKKPVYTIGYGKSMSAGCFLLAAGNKGRRYATTKTSIMFHTVSSGSEGKTADIVKSAEEIQALNETFLKEFAKMSGKTISELKALLKEGLNTDITWTAADAKKFGAIDHVGLPKSILHGQTAHEHTSGDLAQQGTPVFGLSDIISNRLKNGVSEE